MFAQSPENKPIGLLAIHDSLYPHPQLLRACGELRLTVPVILTAVKIANRQPLSDEEQEMITGLNLKRGPKDWRVAPMVHERLDSDSGILSTLDGLKRAGILQTLPANPSNLTRVDDILFSTQIRYQALSVLWDLADGIHKGHRFGSPKPWVVEELQILGFVAVSDPIPDGTKGRPPQKMTINSWGRQFVECTRRYMGLDIPEEFYRMARRRSGNLKPRFSRTDLLAAGYLSQGRTVPERIAQRMSEFGREELSKLHGVEL